MVKSAKYFLTVLRTAHGLYIPTLLPTRMLLKDIAQCCK